MKLSIGSLFLGLIIGSAILGSNSIAASRQYGSLSYTIEPIVGYERAQKLAPSPHTKDRLFYGARATGGMPYLSLEAEATRANDSEGFPMESKVTVDTDDRVKLGLVSTAALVSIFSGTARAGGQASRNTHEETSYGATTKVIGPWKYHPYAGAGLSAALANNFNLNAGLTVVFKDFPKMATNEYQVTSGFSVKFP